ncbi:hypothetical protein CDAR_255341 [Caerostris darwini]|uniref:Uncharacterized protein n=1 Tax=Caerostris darwini TaxID=1538125 RepID=A0AAV4V148_9ARAC|nr:hypothetical protein CDAR_255341 [Caerostris darwini]
MWVRCALEGPWTKKCARRNLEWTCLHPERYWNRLGSPVVSRPPAAKQEENSPPRSFVPRGILPPKRIVPLPLGPRQRASTRS